MNLSITAALLIESEKEEKERIMEALVFALIAVRNGYFVQETIVPEPAEFQPFDLRALKRSYQTEGTLLTDRLAGRSRLWLRSRLKHVDP